jgi:hypothetical protein
MDIGQISWLIVWHLSLYKRKRLSRRIANRIANQRQLNSEYTTTQSI